MNAKQWIDVTGKISKAFPDAVIKKWVSHDSVEEIELEDPQGNYVVIKYYPAGREGLA
ncbi:hypothetical protein [Lentibacillus salicampi]|uniref:hypothetical protein n=1 Tax=Lentibacillus salicampi TaxID=175306 RepID=UPI001430A83B|nr:hypothetical protein [Lentibacillus salicampi]